MFVKPQVSRSLSCYCWLTWICQRTSCFDARGLRTTFRTYRFQV